MSQGPSPRPQGEKIPFLPEYHVGFKIRDNSTGEVVEVVDFESGKNVPGSLSKQPVVIVEIETPNENYAADVTTSEPIYGALNDIRRTFDLEPKEYVVPKSFNDRKSLTPEEFKALVQRIEAGNIATFKPETFNIGEKGNRLFSMLEKVAGGRTEGDDPRRNLAKILKGLANHPVVKVTEVGGQEGATDEAILKPRGLQAGKDSFAQLEVDLKMLIDKITKGVRAFDIEWGGCDRVPSGAVVMGKTIKYTQSGIVVFTDGTTATYDRIIDNGGADGLQNKMRIYMKPNKPASEEDIQI